MVHSDLRVRSDVWERFTEKGPADPSPDEQPARACCFSQYANKNGAASPVQTASTLKRAQAALRQRAVLATPPDAAAGDSGGEIRAALIRGRSRRGLAKKTIRLQSTDRYDAQDFGLMSVNYGTN
jgi:hypothetical protein